MAAAVLSLITILILFIKDKNGRRMLFFLLAGALVCFSFSLWDTVFRERSGLTYIEKQTAGEGEKDVELQAVIEGNDPLDLKLSVPSVGFTEEEAKQWFLAASEELEKTLPGEGNETDRVVRDVPVPSALSGNPAELEWSSSHPAVLSSEGKIGTVPEEGETVTLTCRMSLQDYEDHYLLQVRVFPKEKKDDAGKLMTAAEKLNADPEGTRYYLPEELEGRKVIWYEKPESKAAVLSVIFLLAAVFLIIRRRKRTEEEQKKRNEELKRAYPELISRILLLLCAGLSLRRAIYRIASGYEERKRSGLPVSDKAMFEETVKVCADLNNGISEPEAYERMGDRCADAGYRTLMVMLARGVTRGTAGLVGTLEQEAAASFEDSKRRAKAAGDLAAVKLLLPMALMLVVVMAIVLIPSFLSFVS